MLIRTAIQSWLDSMSSSRSALDARSAAHRVLDDLGDLDWRECTPILIEAWLRRCSDVWSPHRVRTYYWALRGAARAARLSGELDRDPLGLVRAPRASTLTEYRLRCAPLTSEEASALLSSPRTPPLRRAQWGCALLSGVRVGELSALRWSDWQTDVPLDALIVSRSWSTKRGAMGPTKTGVIRRVPVHPELRHLLVAHRGLWRRSFGRAPRPDDLLFPRSWHGGPCPQHQPQVLRAWKRDLIAIGLAARPLHATRHTFLTLAVEAGASESAAFACTHGDASIRGVYRHWQWPTLCEAVALIPVRWDRRKEF
jgi:integrase